MHAGQGADEDISDQDQVNLCSQLRNVIIGHHGKLIEIMKLMGREGGECNCKSMIIHLVPI